MLLWAFSPFYIDRGHRGGAKLTDNIDHSKSGPTEIISVSFIIVFYALNCIFEVLLNTVLLNYCILKILC